MTVWTKVVRGAQHAGLVVLVGAIAACNENNNPSSPTPPSGNAQEVSYAAIGASDAIGIGASVPCFPFAACPDGTGYVPAIARRLRSEGRTVTLTNLGIPGAVLSPEVEELARMLGRGTIGNFIDRELPFVPRTSTVVTVFAGPNDVNTVGLAIEAGMGGDPTAFGAAQADIFGRNFTNLVNGIRSRAPGARIVAVNVPNLAALPYVANRSVAERRILQQLSVAFSARVNSLAASGLPVIDLMCDARSYQPGIYSSDGYHPNDAGYAYLTDRMYDSIRTGTAPPPRPACPEMSLF
jgi:lysophospholipase L1-like esterase